MLLGRVGRRQVHYGIVVMLAAAGAVMAALGFGRLSYPVILPPMQQGLGLSNVQSGLVATVSIVGYLLASIGSGALAGRWGARATIVAGLGTATLGLALTGLAPSFGLALGAQFVNGVGAGLVVGPCMGLAAAWFDPSYRGRASAVITSGAGPGMFLMGLLLPLVMGGANWQAAWLFLAVLVGGSTLLSWLVLRNQPGEFGLRPIGTALDSVSARAGVGGWSTVVRRPRLWHLGVVFLLYGLSFTSYATFFPTFLVSSGGFSQAQAGALWGLVGTIGVLGSLLWGAFSDRFGRRLALAAVYVMLLCAGVLSAFVPGLPGYLVAPLLFGMVAWSVPTLMGAAAGDYFGSRLAYASIGLLNACSATGQAIGPGLAGLGADLTGSFTFAFVAVGVASAVALGLSWVLPKAEGGKQ